MFFEFTFIFQKCGTIFANNFSENLPKNIPFLGNVRSIETKVPSFRYFSKLQLFLDDPEVPKVSLKILGYKVEI